MKNRAIPSAFSARENRGTSSASASLSISEFKQWTLGWFLDCEISQHSAQTLKNRRYYVEKLLWFHQWQEFDRVDVHTLRAFLHHAGRPLDPGVSRWGYEGRGGVTRQTITPGTVGTYHRALSALFGWIVNQEGLDVSPMAKIATPIDRPDQIIPFSPEQVNTMIAAAKKSNQPRRNEALIWILLDTGARVTELANLCMGDLELLGAPFLRVEGKGGKMRPLPLGRTAARALWGYLKERQRDDDEPVFIAEGGNLSGQAMTRSGIEQVITKLGKAAGVDGVRCSPHTFRHTFSIEFLRNGGNQFALMALLGHTDPTMTLKYVRFVQADIQRQHRQHSPADKLNRKK